MKKNFFCAEFVLFVFLLSGQSVFSDYSGAVTAGTAGSGRAAVEASESPFLNPAAIPYLSGYYFTSGFGNSSQDGLNSKDINLSLTDNLKDTLIPTSFAYGQSSTHQLDSGEEFSRRQFKLSFGGFWNRTITSGIGLIYEDDQLPASRYSQTNMVLGAQWVPNKDLGFAVVLDNLFAANNSIPDNYRLKKSTAFAFVANYLKFMRVKVDLVSAQDNDFAYPTFAAGVENYLNRWMIFRVGAQKNNFDNYNLYSTGIGFVLPKFGFQYAYQTSPENNTEIRHKVDLAVPIW